MATWPDVDRTRAAWWAVGGLLAVSFLFVVYSFIGTFVFGVFLYYATRPMYDRLTRRIYPPSLAALVALVLLALPAMLLLAYTLAIALQEFEQFASTADLGPYQEMLGPYLNVSDVVEDPRSILENRDAIGSAQGLLDQGLRYLGFVGNALLHLFIMIAIAFYLLRDGTRLSRWFRHRFGDQAGVLDAYLDNVDRDFNSIFFGNILNAILTGIIGVIAYNGLNFLVATNSATVEIPYPALIGLLAGIASLIPVVGMKLVYVPVSAYLFGVAIVNGAGEKLWFPAAFFAVSFIIVDTIPDFVLRPYVSGRNLHVGMVMFAYIFGPILFGWYGIFLGPILLVLIVHFAELVLPELMAHRELQPYAVDPSNVTSLPESPSPGQGEAASESPGIDPGPGGGEDAGSDTGGGRPPDDGPSEEDGRTEDA